MNLINKIDHLLLFLEIPTEIKQLRQIYSTKKYTHKIIYTEIELGCNTICKIVCQNLIIIISFRFFFFETWPEHHGEPL